MAGKTLLGDIPVGNWVDRYLPAAWRPYARLMRLDRPIGTWLLLWPCWWSISMAAPRGTFPDPWLLALFGVGALVMRGAGCTVNDLADRDIDGKVARTAARPIPSGAVSVKRAFGFLGLLLAIGLAILLQFNQVAVALGVGSLALVAVYPFMKRVTYWPQAWLGLTFNWGALLGWAAATGGLAWPAVALYAGGFFWTLGYDTIYAHQDKDDDALIGVKSAALALGEKTVPFVWGVYAVSLGLIGVAGWLAGLGWPFYAGLGLAALHLAWQAGTVDIHDGADCLAKFKSNRYYGWLPFLAIIAGQVLAG